MQSTYTKRRSQPATLACAMTALTEPARILRRGAPCTVVITQVHASGMHDQRGNDLYTLVLMVTTGGRSASSVRIGTAVPAAGLRLLWAGNRLPARQLPDCGDQALAIDWPAALRRPVRAA